MDPAGRGGESDEKRIRVIYHLYNMDQKIVSSRHVLSDLP
jgi:hypothetical protein